jgi:hypothetical protein
MLADDIRDWRVAGMASTQAEAQQREYRPGISRH